MHALGALLGRDQRAGRLRARHPRHGHALRVGARPGGGAAGGPATHSVWTVRRAGETVDEADKLPEAL